MFTISNNNIITLSKGDEVTTPIFINWGTQLVPVRYKLQEYDELLFNLYESLKQKTPILRKVYTDQDLNKYGDVVLELNREDTINLLAGQYYYEVVVIRRVVEESSDDYSSEDDSSDEPIECEEVYNTVVPRTKFFIVE